MIVDRLVRDVPGYERAMAMIVGGPVDIQVDGICTDGTGAATRFGGVSIGLG